MKMTVTGRASRKPRRPAFQEVETVRDRKDGMHILKQELGHIAGQTDEQYLAALAEVGITVVFEEV